MHTSSLTDNDLFHLVSQSNEQAFTELFNRYWSKVYFIAYSHLHSSTAAEEITQEVFFKLWKKRETLRITLVSAYIAAMTRYAIYHAAAETKKMRAVTLNEESAVIAAPEQLTASEDRMLLEMVEKLSGELPEKCRLVFVQNKLQDRPLQEVARELNISLKTAEAHLTKALKVMRTNLGKSFSSLL